MDCEDVRDDIDLCALGTLPPAEAERVRAHAAACEPCGAELIAAEAVAAKLAMSVPGVRAPEALRTAVRNAIRGEGAAPEARARRPAPPRLAWRSRRLSGRYGALAAVLVLAPLAGLLVWAVVLQRQVNDLREDTARIQRKNDGLLLLAIPSSVKADFLPVGDAQTGVGAVSWNPQRQACMVLFERLPPPGAGAAYRLWYTVDGKLLRDAGEVVLDETGRADVSVDASRWRGQEYVLTLRLEQRPHDPGAPAVLEARLRRP